MKGFLSFLGITIISFAFIAILFIFYGNPLEEQKSQERRTAYQEMRTNHSATADSQTVSSPSAVNEKNSVIMEAGQSCSRLSFEQ